MGLAQKVLQRGLGHGAQYGIGRHTRIFRERCRGRGALQCWQPLSLVLAAHARRPRLKLGRVAENFGDDDLVFERKLAGHCRFREFRELGLGFRRRRRDGGTIFLVRFGLKVRGAHSRGQVFANYRLCRLFFDRPLGRCAVRRNFCLRLAKFLQHLMPRSLRLAASAIVHRGNVLHRQLCSGDGIVIDVDAANLLLLTLFSLKLKLPSFKLLQLQAQLPNFDQYA